MFQSTHPRGVRPGIGGDNGATQRFNPRTHAGCDVCAVRECPEPPCFNPRTHAGCDTQRNPSKYEIACFNPRTHAGCDSTATLLFLSCSVSIHAPTRGATPPMTTYLPPCSCFNPRTHAGCDLNSPPICNYFMVSIHAPTRGATK